MLVERITEMAGLMPDGDAAFLGAADWLATLLAETKMLGQGPRPGGLHVASIRTGGQSGRAHTFIVGLDSGRFAPAGGPDPVLLDGERQTLSAHLSAPGQNRERAVTEFDRLLARWRGRVTLSYPGGSLTEDAETFPSQAMLATFRALVDQPEAGERDVVRALPAVAFAPTGPAGGLNETEWWLGRLCAAQAAGAVGAASPPRPGAFIAAGTPLPHQAASVVAARFPHLGRG